MARLAMVTGASSGIGEAVAIRFAEEGANVAINYLSDAAEAESVRAKAAKANPSGKHVIVQGDVSKEEQIVAMFAATLAALGSIDILVNNAGIQKPSPSHELEAADFDRILDVIGAPAAERAA